MADVGFRDLIGSIAPGRRAEPTVAPPSRDTAPPVEHAPPPAAIVTPPPPAAPALFGPDRQPADALGLEPTFARLAELALHRRTGTPVAMGILGAPGSGKSFALARILDQVRVLAGAAEKTAASPFVSRIHVATIDAAGLSGDPATALAARVHASLRAAYPDLAREIGHGARDPHAALRETNDKLDEVRRRLDIERRALDDAGSRRARLVETVLYETSGSAVDAYARANRAGLERRFAGFGIGGDAIRSYKDYVLYAAGSGGKLSLGLRSLWAFKGQTKLVVFAILLVAIAVGLGVARETQDTWLSSLRGGPQGGVGIATWMEAHIGLLSTARTAAFVLAGLCLLANVWRAAAFLAPVNRGATLLEGDLDGRRRDLDGLYAHQIKRVDALDGDVERLTREVSEAERRAGGRAEPSPFEPSAAGAAQAVFAALATAVGRDKGPAAPQRIVLALDHLDGVPPERADEILDALHRSAGAGIVTLAAVNARSDAHSSVLERCIDLPLHLSTLDEPGALVGRLLGRDGAPVASAKPDASKSALDEPLDEAESDLVAALAPLAGRTPRALRRFVGLYRLARLDGAAPRGALAFTLALKLGGTPAEREAVAQALGSGPSGFALAADASKRLRDSLDAVSASGQTLGEGSLLAAGRQAKRFVFQA